MSSLQRFSAKVFGHSLAFFLMYIATAEEISVEVLDRAKSALVEAVQKGKLVGGTHLVSLNGETVYFERAGFRDVEDQLPFEKDTLVRIYSMTKPITSVTAMALYEQGKFQLDDPVSKYIPAFANMRVVEGDKEAFKLVPPKRALTVRDVFRHTTGYSYGDGHPAVKEAHDRAELRYRAPNGMYSPDMTIEEAAEAMAKIPALHHPGERFTYGFSTDLLGRLIEVWSGKPLDEAMSEGLFVPLAMKDTGFSVPQEKQSRFASCHSTKDGEFVVLDKASDSAYNGGFKFLSGGGGLVSTMDDYANFCSMLINGGVFGEKRILKEETLNLMFSDQLTEIAGDSKFGLGFAISEASVGEDGRKVPRYFWAGYASTDFQVVPELKMFQIFLRQHVPSKHDYARKQFDLLYQGLK